MGLPAMKLDDEVFMEARVARLEEKVDRVQSDVSDLKIEIRGVRSDMKAMDQGLTSKIDGLGNPIPLEIVSALHRDYGHNARDHGKGVRLGVRLQCATGIHERRAHREICRS